MTKIEAFLKRIRYDGAVAVSQEMLRELQQAFLLAIPFENLDIHLGRRIEFTPEAVYRKVVEQGRGGFCYELNSLLHDVLAEIGFDVQFLAATMLKEGKPGTPMGHLVLKVNVHGQEWLADVGNGKSVREPLLFDGSNERSAEGLRYRVGQLDDSYALFETDAAGVWHPRYLIDVTPRKREEFKTVCDWTQTSPDSIFTQRKVATIARPDGRALLLNNTLTITTNDSVVEREIPSDQLEPTLREMFGIQY